MKYNLVYQFDCTCMKIPFLSVSAGLFLVGFCKFGLCLFVNVPSQIASKFTADELHRIASILSKTVSIH